MIQDTREVLQQSIVNMNTRLEEQRLRFEEQNCYLDLHKESLRALDARVRTLEEQQSEQSAEGGLYVPRFAQSVAFRSALSCVD